MKNTIAAHARRLGLSARTVYNRVARGIPVEKAFGKTVKPSIRKPSSGHFWRQSIER